MAQLVCAWSVGGRHVFGQVVRRGSRKSGALSRRAGVALLVISAAILPFVSSPAAGLASGSDPFIWARQRDLSWRSFGIDGYIRGSGLVSVPGNNHVDEWIALNDTDPQTSGFVQAGQTQGWGFASDHVEMYSEGSECFGARYLITHLLAPPTPNYPMYVFSDGVARSTTDCNGNPTTWYEYAVRVGSFGNPIKMTFLMSDIDWYPEAAQEEYYDGSEIHINQNWWGLDNGGGVNPSYALHRWDSVNWAVWTQSSFPGTTGPDCPVSPAGTANPFVYVSKVPMYSAFQVHDGGTCPH